jgi:16S rRNA (cytidine1402-2'-O)-methyltransferase
METPENPDLPVLYLLPVPISDTENRDWLGNFYKSILKDCKVFFVENERTSRRFISGLKLGIAIDQLIFKVLDKDTDNETLKSFGSLLGQNKISVLMSESGCPGIADPGSKLVAEAHKAGVKVKPLAGPSSIFLALMASGLSGQSFAFHGYLPIEQKEKIQEIRLLEKESIRKKQTQIFIETPYRNDKIWKSLLENLNPETRLGFAFDLLGADEKIAMKAVKDWKRTPEMAWKKLPTVFFFMV